jgi:hypothetical protein
MFISYKPDLCLPVTSAGHSFFSGGLKIEYFLVYPDKEYIGNERAKLKYLVKVQPLRHEGTKKFNEGLRLDFHVTRIDVISVGAAFARLSRSTLGRWTLAHDRRARRRPAAIKRLWR